MVPVSYEADPSLAPWINKRRIAYKQGDMPDYQITLLDDIGFVWKTDINNPKTSLIQRHWEEYFQRLVKYKQKCGNCRVVYNSEGERSLASWLVTQRDAQRRGLLPPARFKRLDDLGFLWTVNDSDSTKCFKIFNRIKNKMVGCYFT